MQDYGVSLVWLVANSLVVGYGDPAQFSYRFEPFLVRVVRSEMVLMPFDRQSRSGQYGRKLFAEIAISKESECHAARS